MQLILQATIYKKINTKKFPCDETNAFKLTKCYNEFYMKKLKCKFPWIKSGDFSSLEKCESKHKTKDLVELIKKVNTEELNDEIVAFGCNITNCDSVKWASSSLQTVPLPNDPGRVFFSLIFPSSAKVLVIEESLAYTMKNLLADFGGFAGIFVGASIMTIYDLLLNFGSKAGHAIRKFFE